MIIAKNLRFKEVLMKKLITVLLLFCIFLYLSGCSGNNGAPASSQNIVNGTVSDASNTNEISGATVTLDGKTVTTDSEGEFTFYEMNHGTYTIAVSKTGFISYSETVTLNSARTTLEISLFPPGYAGTVEGRVIDGNTSAGISGATVTIDDTSTTTDSDGNYSINNVQTIFHDITAQKTGYNNCSSYFTVNTTTPVTVNFTMYTSGTTGNLSGIVKKAGEITLIGGATVSCAGASGTSEDVGGTYTVTGIPAGTQEATVSKNYYSSQSANVDIVPSTTATKIFELTLDTKLIRKQPYLLFAGETTSMTVMWQTYYTPDDSKIEWGYTTTYEKGSATVHENSSAKDEHIFSHTITGLTSATKVYYRVKVNSDYYPAYFITPTEKETKSVVFYGYGDTRTQPFEHDKVLKAVMADMDEETSVERHSFLLHGGDYTSRGLTENYWDDEYFNPDTTNVQKFLARIPVFGTLGNHELYKASAHNGCITDRKDGGKLYRKYWPYPFYPKSDRFYISYDYGPVHVASLDVFLYPTIAPGEEEHEWLDHDLATTDKKWKIVILHAPIYASTTYSKEKDSDLFEVFKRRGVKLVVQSHVHYFSHVDVTSEEIQYLTIGGGGAPLGPVTPYNPVSALYPIVAAEEYNFARFEANENSLKISAFNSDGKLLDYFEIK